MLVSHFKRFVRRLILEGFGQILNLLAQAAAHAFFFVRAFPVLGFLQAALVELQKSFQRFGGQINAFAFHRPEVFGGQNVVVKQVEGQAVDDGMPKFFHEIEGERGPAVDDAMKKAEIRIEAMSDEQRKDFIGEQAVAETERGIDRVFGRPPGARFKRQFFAEHLAEGAKIGGGGAAFGAHEAVDGLQVVQIFQRVIDEFQFPGKRGFRMTELVAQDDGAAVADFAFDEDTRQIELEGVVEVALILGEAQENVFGIGGDEPAAQFAMIRQEGHVDAFFEQGADGLGGELDAAKDEQALELDERNGAEPLVVFGDDEVLRRLAHDGALFGDIDGGHGW